MKIADHLNKKQKYKLNHIVKSNKKVKKRNPTPKKKEENINWADIMGMNRDTYKRSRGAIRRK